MRTLFTGCVSCGILTTNVEGYCRDCAAARDERRRREPGAGRLVHATERGKRGRRVRSS